MICPYFGNFMIAIFYLFLYRKEVTIVRLNKSVRDSILLKNDGYTTKTMYVGKNYKQECIYSISKGKLYIKTKSRNSLTKNDKVIKRIADDKEVIKFIRKYEDCLEMIEEEKK